MSTARNFYRDFSVIYESAKFVVCVPEDIYGSRIRFEKLPLFLGHYDLLPLRTYHFCTCTMHELLNFCSFSSCTVRPVPH